MGRAPCCDKAKVKRGPWSPEEDDTLKAYLLSHGTGGNWIALPAKAGLKRCGKSCRLRWLNYLRPDIKHGGFTPEEDQIICSYYNQIGSRWAVIASQLPGRTDNDVKNYWNTKLKKKLLAGNIVPTTNLNNNNNYSPSSSSSPCVPRDKQFLVSPADHQSSCTYSPIPAVTDKYWSGLNYYNPDLYRPVQPPPSDLDYLELVEAIGVSRGDMINVVSQEGSSDSSSFPAMPSISGGPNSIADQDFGFGAFPYDIWYPNMGDLTLNTNQY